jgi:hypothetical protein
MIAEELSVRMSATDELSGKMATASKNVEKTTASMSKFQNVAGKRVEMASARMAQGAIMDLTGSVPGLNTVVMMFSGTLMKLMAVLGPIGWAIAGVTLAATTLTKVIKGAEEAKRKLAETAAGLSSTYANLANEMGKTTEQGRRYLETARSLQFQSLMAVNVEKEQLLAKIDGRKATEKQAQKLLELEAKAMGASLAIKRLTEDIMGLSEKQKEQAAIEAQGVDFGKQFQQREEDLEKFALARISSEESVIGIELELARASELEKASIREIAMAQAEQQYAGMTAKLQAAAEQGINITQAQEAIQLAIRKKAAENEIKLSAEKNKVLLDHALTFGKYSGEVFAAMMTNQKISSEQVISDMLVMWIDYYEKKFLLAQAEAIATMNFFQMAAVGVAFGIARGLAKSITKSTAVAVAMPELPSFESDKGVRTDLDRSIEKAEKVGGRSISTAHSQIINYITVAPRFDMLDIEGMREPRAKEIANYIGQYLQEATGAGSVGLS